MFQFNPIALIFDMIRENSHVNINLFDCYFDKMTCFTRLYVHMFSGVCDRTSTACGVRSCTREHM